MRTADGWWSVTATISLVVWDETGERKRFASAILPAWARKSPQVAEVLPLLYLHGLSSSDFTPALEQFLGSAAGLSAATITRRITTRWHDDITAFNKRSLTETDYVYRWVDGIHLKGPLGPGQGLSAGDLDGQAQGVDQLPGLGSGLSTGGRARVGRAGRPVHRRGAPGCFSAAAAVLVPRAMVRLRGEHRALEVVMTEGSSPAQLRRLRTRRLDVAVIGVGPG